MNTLYTKCPQLPNDGQQVLVMLEDGTITGAKYTAKVWKISDDLQKSFEPVGVTAISSIPSIVQPQFECRIESWGSLESFGL